MSEQHKSPLEQVILEQQHRKNAARGEQRRLLKSAGKPQNNDRKPKGGRENWRTADPTDWEDLDVPRTQRIMPRDEGDRRRALAQAAFKTTEAPHDGAAIRAGLPTGDQGVVVEVSTGLCRVEVDGQTLLCHIRGNLRAQEVGFTNAIATGDEVIVRDDGAGGGVVEAVLPRRSILARPDVFSSHLRQVIVANADQVLIVASWRDPLIWLELVDRYLITAERSQLPAVICVNKIDLAEDAAAIEATLAPYRRLGCRILLTSAETGQGIDELRELLRDRLSVLAGLSGVGKSTLLTTVQPGLQLRTGAVSSMKKHQGEGRHTTTQARLIRLEVGGGVVDTPGIREFGLSGLRKGDLVSCFAEVAAELETCRFKNCTHHDEPDCAIRAAVANGTMAASRYHSYRSIYAELP